MPVEKNACEGNFFEVAKPHLILFCEAQTLKFDRTGREHHCRFFEAQTTI